MRAAPVKKRFWRCERGAAAVEFAFIVPIMALVVMGIVDYGTFINQRMKLQDLARTATQYVVQGGSDTDVVANIIESSDFYKDSAAKGQAITVTRQQLCECAGGRSINCNSSCPNSGDYIRYFYAVTLDSTYRPIFAYPGISSSIALRGYARMPYNP